MMKISIRPDWCIALRMIAIQEHERIMQEALNKFLGDGYSPFLDDDDE